MIRPRRSAQPKSGRRRSLTRFLGESNRRHTTPPASDDVLAEGADFSRTVDDNPFIESIDILVVREQMAGAHDEFLASVAWALRFTI